MNAKLAFAAFLLCLAFVAAITIDMEAVHAQKKPDAGLSGDKDLATKKGMDALANKKFDQNKLPGKWKIGFAFGSIAAAFAAIKYL